MKRYFGSMSSCKLTSGCWTKFYHRLFIAVVGIWHLTQYLEMWRTWSPLSSMSSSSYWAPSDRPCFWSNGTSQSRDINESFSCFNGSAGFLQATVFKRTPIRQVISSMDMVHTFNTRGLRRSGWDPSGPDVVSKVNEEDHGMVD
jgi:hypothetical protein